MLLISGVGLLAGAEPSVKAGPPFSPARSAFVHPDTAPDMEWRAQWIGAAVGSRPNQWTAFRRQFTVNRLGAKAVARVAVDSKYWLWVNGELVVREGGLKRGPTPTDTYYDEVDLKPHLRLGENTVAVLVWYFGKEGFSHKDSGRSGLLFQMDESDEGTGLVSDHHWIARELPAYGETGDPQPNFRLPESNIHFDARLDLVGWMQPAAITDNWAPAVELGHAPCAPWNRLVRRPVPLWTEQKLDDYTNSTEFPAVTKGGVIAAKLPYNAQVTPYLKIEAPAGLLLDIRTDNYTGGSANNVRTEYITREGVQEFETPGWMNGHAVHYSMPPGIKILRLAYRESGYRTAPVGTFSCDDPFLNRLRAKAARTLYLTMRDTYMDCPDRERSQWWGDVVNELGEVFYAFDRDADALTRKGMLELIAWQKPDGVLFAPIPAGNWEKDLPLQMLASVGRKGFWTYGLYSGDFATLRAVYPGVKRYLEIWDMQPNGLVMAREGAWPWGDWGENVDMTVLTNAWYYLALQGMREMALALGHPEDLPWIDRRLSSIRRSFDDNFWTGQAYRSPGNKGETDDRANALAVVAGLAKPAQFPALLEVFRTQKNASPFMEKYVLEALCLMGRADLAQVRMKSRFAAMVDNEAYTTLWEGWGIGKEGFGGGTINHAWSGGPLTIMSQYFAGIAPLTPAFATYHILPQPGSLRKMAADVATRKGAISMRWQQTEAAMEMEVVSPAGTVATVGLPLPENETFSEIQVNGVLVWSRDATASELPGLHVSGVAGERAKHFLFEVQPGRWVFRAKLSPAPTPLSPET